MFVISDDLKHDAIAVSVFINTLIVHLQIMYPNIDTVNIWLDGCAAQYKCKHAFYNLSDSFKSSMRLVWNFFGSRHGKCAADGEAAVVKTLLTSEATGRELIIGNAWQVHDHLTHSNLLKVDGASHRHFYLTQHVSMKKAKMQHL